MDFTGYAALGGLERLTIVAGAVIIGYWGYRLYTADRNAGLVFMGLAVVVLVGALATGGSYVRSVSEGYQVASLPASPAQAPATDPFEAKTRTIEPVPVQEPVEPAPVPAVAPEPVTAADAPAEPGPGPEIQALTEARPGVQTGAEEETSPVRLATGEELGGRILSVKSENVSLEWSSDSD